MVYSGLSIYPRAIQLQRHHTVVIADDHDIVRKALADVLLSESGAAGPTFEIVAQAVNGLDAIA